jgi:uncharacterized protein YfaT (DUF1175 family)
VEELPLDETITFVEARETGKTALKILGEKLSSGQVNKVQQERENHRSCTYCGQKGHRKSPSTDLRKADCPAFGKKCTNCHQKGHYTRFCKMKGDKKDETPPDSKKTTTGAHHFTINRMKTSEKSGKITRVSQTTQNLMKKTAKYEEVAP